MSLLQPDNIKRRYADLVELGLSRLPALAPLHTDHNAHDPGITLMELLAAVAEAQLYAVGRIRRDERDAFAALMGVRPHGTRPASGLLWPDRSRPDAPANTYRTSFVIDGDTSVRLRDSPQPAFHPVRPLLWAPCKLRQLTLRTARGAIQQFLALNERGVGFMPFGESAGHGDKFVLSFEAASPQGLLPPTLAMPESTCWAIGVRVADSVDEARSTVAKGSPLSAVLIADQRRLDVPIVEDTSSGMLRTGYLLLDLSAVKFSPASFAIEFRAPRGLDRAPRVLQVQPNVVPITQRREIRDELLMLTGEPGFSHRLEHPGLCFEPGSEAVRIISREAAETAIWQRCDDLSTQGPSDRAFELDIPSERVRFGNGVNGIRAQAKPAMLLNYAVSDGEQGNVARNRAWIVSGIDGVFGSNLDPVTGGEGSNDRQQMRGEARRRFADDRALVSAVDIQDAAAHLRLLGVARSWVAPADAELKHTGTVRLVAMCVRPDGNEPSEPPETRRWLSAVRRALAPRLPLGTRLHVTAPRYRDFLIRAEVVAEWGRDPVSVEREVRSALVSRLLLVPRHNTDMVRAPGVGLTVRDVTAWILKVPGVNDVKSLVLTVGRQPVDEVKVPADGLPRLDIGASVIEVGRPTSGGALP
jgi:predicted phage baseplate assembly protein